MAMEGAMVPEGTGIAKPSPALARVRERIAPRGSSPGEAGLAKRLEAYLDARALEIDRDHAGAARRFLAIVEEDPPGFEPRLAAARCLLEGPHDARLAESLRGLLTAGDPRYAQLWNAWLRVSFVDLHRTAGAVLQDLPGASRPGNAPQRVTYQEEVRWLLERLDRREPLRIRCGGEHHVDTKGKVWERDRFFKCGGCSGPATGGWLPTEIHGTDDGPLYAGHRFFDRSVAAPTGYRIPVPSGRYRVTLHFAEVWTPRAEVRVFDVHMEGKTVLADYDPVKAVGFAHADARRFEVEVVDGLLDIEFDSKHHNPMISAIEIERE